MKSAKDLYEDLSSDRQPFLDRARDAAALTIPGLVPREGHTAQSRFATPWQSVGARGVTNLSSKLLLTLLPPNTPFFRLTTDPALLDLANQIQNSEGEIQESLSKIERSIAAEIETISLRPQFHEACLHLVVAGNVLQYFPPKGGPVRNFLLPNYVIERDAEENVLTIVTLEELAFDACPEDVQAAVKGGGEEPVDKTKNVQIHTAVVMTAPGQWKTWQEANGKKIARAGRYNEDSFPYLPLRWSHVSGESYGRGQVEPLMGDLKSLEGLSQAIVEGAAAAARLLVLVKPSGSTRLKDIAGAPNGAVRSGDAEDVTMLQSEKSADLQTAAQVAAEIKQSLSFAFLLNSSVQRNAERVTAEEIRFMAQELEDTLGGVYSLLGAEFQLPLVKLVMARLQRQGRLPKLNKKVVKPTIIAGLDALGRGHDLQRLRVSIATIQEAIGPEGLAMVVKTEELCRRIMVASGVPDLDTLLKTREELAQEAQQAQQAQLIQNTAPEVVKGAMAATTRGT